MQISAINKFSLIEFPGEVSAIIFTPGCNFRCGYCHNSEFVLEEKLKNIYKNLILEKAFFNFLEQRKGLLSGVSICGGEPTLQKDLYDFCLKVKSFGYKVKLDTNGRDPEILKKLLENNLVDYVAMDIKHEVGSFDKIIGVKIDEKPYLESINLLKNSNIDYEFRTTLISGIHDENIVVNISKYLSGAKAYYLQNYRAGNTLDPNFFGKSFTSLELEKFKNIAKKYIKNVQIRN
ncbi:MAG: anaerobic ribonucleoside-triphosphate reductase activating protein [Candidatus Gracilibacteria bacterium]|nr:anaerobic ribonucleoside-triphosphate reductase activating protein [Candidatus Gracilibacteria bacterium]